MRRQEYTHNWMRVAPLGVVALVAMVASAQEIDLPWGPVKRVASPDGALILYYANSTGQNPQLWIEEVHTHRRTKLLDIGGTLNAVWSSDGRAFYVNNRWASDRETSFIYDAATLQRLDIAASIQTADPRARGFADGHTYYEIERWIGTQQVAVRFWGHTDTPPVTLFEFRYAISRAGAVEKAGERISRR
jgi:hypothetical protein